MLMIGRLKKKKKQTVKYDGDFYTSCILLATGDVFNVFKYPFAILMI